MEIAPERSSKSSGRGSRRTSGIFIISVLAATALSLAFYAWTAWTSGALPPSRGHLTDYYNQLVHGLLKGHAYLDVPVDPAMTQASNPYEYQVWHDHGWMVDASYFQGHYYLYFGIVPALFVLLPYHLVTGLDLWPGTSVFFVTAVWLVVMALLWARICRRYFAASRAFLPASGILLVGLNAGVLALVRRPDMYELPIAAGLVFLALTIHCFLSAGGSSRPRCWAVLAGVCLGLAVGSRPPFLFAGLAAICWIACRPAGQRLGAFLGFSAGFGVIFAGLLFYNYVRFGNFLEFGFRYQLTDPPAAARHFISLQYFWYNLRAYFWTPLKWQRYYPFYETVANPQRPSGYFLSEWVYGLLKYAPALWAMILPVWAIRRSRTPRNREILGILAGCWIGPLALDLVIESSAIRYMADFLPSMLLTSAVAFGLADQEWGRPWPRLALRCAWAAAVAASIVVAAIVSIPIYGSMLAHQGADFQLGVARILNLPTSWVERALDRHYGSITLTTQFVGATGAEKLLATPEASVFTRAADPGAFQVGVQYAGEKTQWSRSLPIGNGRHVIAATLGALYPDESNPLYLKHAFSSDGCCETELSVDGEPILDQFRLMPAAESGKIHWAAGLGRDGAGWFSGKVLAVTRNQLVPAGTFKRDFEPWQLSFRLPGEGKWPLWSAAAENGGDTLFLEVGRAGLARYGFQSRALTEPRFSPWFAARPGEMLQMVSGADALTPSQSRVGSLRSLWVEGPGDKTWIAQVPVTGARAANVALGESALNLLSSPKFPGDIGRHPAPAAAFPDGRHQTVLLRVVLPREANLLMREPILVWGKRGAVDAVSMIYYDINAVRFAFEHWGLGPVLEGDIVGESHRMEPHEIQLSLEPLSSAPVPAGSETRGRIRIWFDGRPVMSAETPMFASDFTDVSVGENRLDVAGEHEFHGSILLKRWLR